MNAHWNENLGVPDEFLAQVQQLAEDFKRRTKSSNCDLTTIRDFVKSRDYEISDDPRIFREILGTFVCVVRDYYAQDVRAKGLFKKRIEVAGPGYRGELLDLFYRCVFEGLDLSNEGEGVSRPGQR